MEQFDSATPTQIVVGESSNVYSNYELFCSFQIRKSILGIVGF